MKGVERVRNCTRWLSRLCRTNHLKKSRHNHPVWSWFGQWFISMVFKKHNILQGDFFGALFQKRVATVYIFRGKKEGNSYKKRRMTSQFFRLLRERWCKVVCYENELCFDGKEIYEWWLWIAFYDANWSSEFHGVEVGCIVIVFSAGGELQSIN